MRSPAFQFYPDDWLSCEKVSTMTPACEGAYIRLLSYAWRSEDCGLPSDNGKLAILSRMGEAWQCDGIAMVLPCFFEKEGRLYNKRLLQEREKQKKYAAKQSENAKSRWHKEITTIPPHSHRNAKSMPPQCSPSSSPSSSPNIIHNTHTDDSRSWTLQQVCSASEGLCMPESMVTEFYNHYNATGWLNKNGIPIVNLKSALANWKKNQPTFGKAKYNDNRNNADQRRADKLAGEYQNDDTARIKVW